jgi:hypothetical protein
LSNFAIWRTTSAQLSDYGKRWRSQGTSYVNPLNAAFGADAYVDAEKATANMTVKRIIGGWEIGSVTDAAAAPSILPDMKKRKRASVMSMNACVNIQWVDSFKLHERYFAGAKQYFTTGHNGVPIAP